MQGKDLNKRFSTEVQWLGLSTVIKTVSFQCNDQRHEEYVKINRYRKLALDGWYAYGFYVKWRGFKSYIRWPTTVTEKTKTSRQKQNTSRQNQSYFAVKYLVLPWGFWFCHNVFVFAVRFLVSPWGFWFRREVFCFCRDVFGLPWQLWATIPYILPTVFFLLLFTTLSYKSPILWVKVTIWLWGIHSSHNRLTLGIHSSHNHLTLGYPF